MAIILIQPFIVWPLAATSCIFNTETLSYRVKISVLLFVSVSQCLRASVLKFPRKQSVKEHGGTALHLIIFSP